MNGRKQPPADHPTTPAERLESWKEIAVYLRRGVRTVRRWEKEEGLPVHRQLHRKQATVYALRSELDAWREGRSADVTTVGAALKPARPREPRLMIAVLPFNDLSGDSEQEYVADGLTEEMIGQLGRFYPETLGVIARTTVMQYKRTNRTVRQIGEELNVDYLVEGSLRREADRVRVNAQLIHTGDQTHLWSGTYEQEMRSILVLQRELARDIGREIRLTLSPQQRTLSGVGAMDRVNPDAYHAHLKGRHFLSDFTPKSIRRSVELFRQAIDADPTYAPAHASLAEAYELLPMWLDEPHASSLPRALEAAEHALRLDPDLPEAHASLGLINANYVWDWSKADRHFRRALELNPSCSPARQWHAEFLAEMGRLDEALETIERALLHDPRSRAIQATRAFVLLLARRFDEAVAQAELVLKIDPDYPMALIRLGLGYAAKGMYADAVRALRKAAGSAPELLDCVALLGYAHAMAGDKSEALKHLDALRREARARYVPAFLFSGVYLGLGQQEKAIRCMEREYESRGWYLLLIGQAHQFDPLRSHPRFQALLRRMNFPYERRLG